MHEITMFALYDKKAEMYDTPLFFLKQIQAERWFYQLAQSREGRFLHFKNDMELHKITKFNVNNGKIFDDKVEVVLQGSQIKLDQKGDVENEKRNEA